MNKIATLTGGLFALTTIASAQFKADDFTPYGFAVRGGLVLPIDSNFRSIENNFAGIGIDYALQTTLIKGTETYLSLDWIFKSAKANRNSIFPVNINFRFPLGNASEGGLNLYGFAGIGAVVFNLTNSNTQLGGRIGAGANINQNFFAEASFFFSDRLKNTSIKATSVGFYLGYRF